VGAGGWISKGGGVREAGDQYSASGGGALALTLRSISVAISRRTSKSLENGSVLQSLGELLPYFGSDRWFESSTSPLVTVRDDAVAVIFSHGTSF